MKKLGLALGIFTVGMTTQAPTAHAWLKFKNSTPNTIWTAHAFASTSGFLCGWNDGCSGSVGDWRVQGWWAIAPGGTATVQSNNYGNAYHDYYAEDAFGHVWKDGGGTYPVFYDFAFDHCDKTDFIVGGDSFAVPIDRSFRRLRGSRCCGGSCPADFTLNFVL